MERKTSELIRDFNIAFGRPVNDKLVRLSVTERELLGKLMLEECLEYICDGLGLRILINDDAEVMPSRNEPGYVYYPEWRDFDPACPGLKLEIDEGRKYDPIESADGLADINVVAHFAAHWHGFDLDSATEYVNDSNMSKLGKDGKAIINVLVECDECGGRGLLNRDPDDHERCWSCGGKGKYLRDPSKPAGKILKGPNFWQPDWNHFFGDELHIFYEEK